MNKIDAERAFDRLNLYCSGHAPEAVLMGMDGEVLHRWGLSYGEAFPDELIHPGDGRRDFWRRVHLYPNGDLLAVFEGLGVIKVDEDSNLLWSVSNRSHHDFWIHESGEIYILTRTAKMIQEVNEQHPIL